jgi:hypothetical protein
MSFMAGRTRTEGLGLIVVRHTSVSVTLQKESRDRALSPRPSKEAQNLRKVSKYDLHDVRLRPHHITCTSIVVYQSHTMLLAVLLTDNLSFLLRFYLLFELYEHYQTLVVSRCKSGGDRPSV